MFYVFFCVHFSSAELNKYIYITLYYIIITKIRYITKRPFKIGSGVGVILCVNKCRSRQIASLFVFSHPVFVFLLYIEYIYRIWMCMESLITYWPPPLMTVKVLAKVSWCWPRIIIMWQIIIKRTHKLLHCKKNSLLKKAD